MHHKTKRRTQRIIKSGVKEVTADIYEIRGESISAWGTTNIKSQFGILSLNSEHHPLSNPCRLERPIRLVEQHTVLTACHEKKEAQII